MSKKRNLKVKIFIILLLVGAIFISPIFNYKKDDSDFSKTGTSVGFVEAGFIPTSVIITVCGNGVLDAGEICDDGLNNGQYASSAENRFCSAGCDGWAPYCGDGQVQSDYGEECDDGNNASGDGCSAVCKSEAPPGGGGGGGGVFIPPSVETKVVLSGKAYPGSDINILKDGELLGVTTADPKASFEYKIEDISAGVYTFGLWAEDKDGIKSITYTLTFKVTAKTITTVSGIFLPPTITIDKSGLRKGEILNIFGQTIPEVEVNVHVLSKEVIATTTSDGIGAWLLPFDTSFLEEGSHTAKARFNLNGYEKSGFGRLLDFYIGKEVPSEGNQVCPYADLNKDGKINLIDFSILLYWWGKKNSCCDQNMNGIVDLSDFSIMMFYWTG